MDTSILALYNRIGESVGSLPQFDEMLFYTGSPDAEILVVSEAPTFPNGPGDHTLYHAVTKEMNGAAREEIARYLRYYPFREGNRNSLYEQYVDRILAFCDRPENVIGFTDLCKRPLDAFGQDTDLEDVWDEHPYCHQEVVIEQIRAVNPRLVVCNKKNVSELLSQAYLEDGGYDGDWPNATWDEVPSEGLMLVYSTMAHMQMSLLSRKRLSEEIHRLYRGD